MKKNVSGQKIGVQMVSATDGSAFTGSVTVSVTGDAGTQATGSVGSGACTHEGNGYHTYAPHIDETNYDLIAFTFTGSGAVPATVQVYTLPTTGILAPATADRTLVVDASGLADANVVKLGPTGSGTAQTAKDLGAINVTNLNTLSGHDPGATLGTSTLTQTQVTGGAYALNSSSFAFASAMDFTTAQKAATLARVTLVDTLTTNSDKTGYALTSAYDFAKGTTAMTESYSTDGSAPTPAQALLLIQQALTEFVISGTTMTIKKVDGSTTAATLTLNDGTSPTGVTRAS